MNVVREHFAARAERYNRSSRWVTDPELASKVLEHFAPSKDDSLVDVACGTGLVGKALKPHINRLVGVDITEEMTEQAKGAYDELVIANAEELPFKDYTFDLAICRQGIQFMDGPRAVSEMVRVIKPGGKICLIHLCAYGEEDREEYFEILRLRNAARRNFYVKGDLDEILREAGCSSATEHYHVSIEDVDVWSNTGAIEESAREGIRQVYRDASDAFRKLHSVEMDDGRIVDHMLFAIAIGIK